MTQNEHQTADKNAQSSSLDARSWFALAAAALFVIGFIVAIVFMFILAQKSSDAVWQRLIYVYSGIEAVVFAAVGWLFGREVNRKQVEGAEQRADESGKAAKEATERAADLDARGRAAKAAVAARRTTYADPEQALSRGFSDDSANAAAADINELGTFMDMLFPD